MFKNLILKNYNVTVTLQKFLEMADSKLLRIMTLD